MPRWCVPFEANIKVGGKPRRPYVKGNCVYISGLKPGGDVTLTFPVFERILDREIAGKTYRIKLRGSNVVEIEPKGIACPLYANQPTGKLVKKTRFIPRIEHITW